MERYNFYNSAFILIVGEFKMDSKGLATKEEDLLDEKNFSNLCLEYRTKLNPKKKSKDTRNCNSSVCNLYPRNSNSLDHTSSDILDNKTSHSENLSKAIPMLDNETYPRLYYSHRHMNSSYPSGNEHYSKILERSLYTLPAKMWWVPPLKEPSNCAPPSVSMSSNSYSNLSSSKRPKVIRSSEDLRKKVISQCHLLEAVNNEKIDEASNEEMKVDKTSPVVDSNDLNWVPPLNIPKSTLSTAAEIGDAPKSIGQLELQQSLNEFASKQNDICVNIVQEIQKSFSTESSQSDKADFSGTELNFTIADVARKHIVNPLTAKLARLCTKQGQMYLDVINELEKSCKKFEDACKNDALRK